MVLPIAETIATTPMTTAVQIGETARDRADFCRCFKTGAAVFLHDDGIAAHSTYGTTPRSAGMRA